MTDKPQLPNCSHLNEGVDVVHERLGSADNELINTCNGMRSEREGGREKEIIKKMQKEVCHHGNTVVLDKPDLGAVMFKELQELWNHDVEGPVECITV